MGARQAERTLLEHADRLSGRYAAVMTTGVPTWTWSKSQVASGMRMRMQPCDAE
jgi:hypothetical protein